MALVNSFHLEQVRNLLDQAEPFDMLRNSYRDYHAKGLDYVCLHRSTGLTIKAYFLNVPTGVNVVNPHDHAYNFHTFILKGRLKNLTFKTGSNGEWWNEYRYQPPASNIGRHQFILERSVHLDLIRDDEYPVGTGYYMEKDEIHTIQSLTPDTVMLLYQYQTPLAKKLYGTALYTQGFPPSVEGLYNEFTEDEIEQKIKVLRDLVR